MQIKANKALVRTQTTLRFVCAVQLYRSSARSADERARVVPNIGFSALRAVEPSLERHRFAATSSSRTRVR